MKWYILHDKGGDGAYNMALDVFLLENPPSRPLVRFYTWDPPAISLGYNQKIPKINTGSFDKYYVDLVRRPTGGRAVYHCCELTYSVVIPKHSNLYSFGIHKLYGTLSNALTSGLRQYGIEAEVERNKISYGIGPGRSLECFESAARFEIKNNGKKIVGSAQRRTSQAVLQHGSILLSDEQHLLRNFLKNTEIKTVEQNLPVTKIHNKSNFEETTLKGLTDSIILGFEKELNCRWEEKTGIRNFLAHRKRLEDIYSLYRSKNNIGRSAEKSRNKKMTNGVVLNFNEV